MEAKKMTDAFTPPRIALDRPAISFRYKPNGDKTIADGLGVAYAKGESWHDKSRWRPLPEVTALRPRRFPLILMNVADPDMLRAVDIDDCVKAGVIMPCVVYLIERTSHAIYWEFSPSGNGVRGFAVSQVDPSWTKAVYNGSLEGVRSVEWLANKLASVTGNRIAGPVDLEDATDEFLWVLEELKVDPSPGADPSSGNFSLGKISVQAEAMAELLYQNGWRIVSRTEDRIFVKHPTAMTPQSGNIAVSEAGGAVLFLHSATAQKAMGGERFSYRALMTLYGDGIRAKPSFSGVATVMPSDVIIKNVDWLWPGYIPKGMPTLIAARYGHGKTTMVTDIACRVIQGGSFPIGKGQFMPGKVLHIHPDEQAEDVMRRYVLAGMSPASMDGKLVLVPPHKDMRLESLDWLRSLLFEHNPDLAILDTIGDLDEKGDLQAPGPGKVATALLAQIVGEAGCAMICLSHTKKGGGSGRHDAAYGAASTFGSYRAGFIIYKKPPTGSFVELDESEHEPHFGLFSFKMSHKKPPRPFRFDLEPTLIGDIEGVRIGKWHDEAGFTESEAMAVGMSRASPVKDTSRFVILEGLKDADGCVLSSVEMDGIAKDAGIASKSFAAARSALFKEHKIVRRRAQHGPVAVYFWALAGSEVALRHRADSYVKNGPVGG